MDEDSISNYEEILLEERMPEPTLETIEFLKQFARVYHSENSLPLPSIEVYVN